MPNEQNTTAAGPDKQLLERFIHDRDEAAFRAIVQRYASVVFGVCMRVLSCHDDAEDAFQMTFLRLAKDSSKILKRESLGAWLYGVAFRESCQIARKRKRLRTTKLLDEDSLPDRAVVDTIEKRHQQNMLDEALNSLPDKYRIPLVLHYFFGKSRQEIASETGTSLNVVKGQLQRGKDALKLRLALRGVQLSIALALVHESSQTVFAQSFQSLVDAAVQQSVAAVPASPTPTSIWNGATPMTKAIFATAASTLVFLSGWVVVLGTSRSYAERQPLVSPLEFGEATEDPSDTVFVAFAQDEKKTKVPVIVKYGDGKADGKKSLAGTGEMIKFEVGDDGFVLRGIKIHGARYGYPRPPKEDFMIYVLSDDGKEVLSTKMAPYSKFKRGESKWVSVLFKKPVKVPSAFWVALDFKAERTKGVYVSYDTNTKGKYSKDWSTRKTSSRHVNTGGDWMVQALVRKSDVK